MRKRNHRSKGMKRADSSTAAWRTSQLNSTTRLELENWSPRFKRHQFLMARSSATLTRLFLLSYFQKSSRAAALYINVLIACHVQLKQQLHWTATKKDVDGEITTSREMNRLDTGCKGLPVIPRFPEQRTSDGKGHPVRKCDKILHFFYFIPKFFLMICCCLFNL